ncbi:hydantoinase/oxoprolinase family protein [Bradyrhizobium sp. NP1]|uniref:hydantoinase/oxoprolinase family protein n=1 Tax=Bradyrhizobium sp. NP1 TaxID=3049772 RepID=UPI0025A5CE4A|nr:hydantoinase/oxoprolinase family protein [Bradyrhizobium sp. NP1]WJR77276.1 hydantoinase/oxoprolinase family protein [Bradyrhizobium sp. NP1]
MSWIAGVDVGGTFTDIVLVSLETREVVIRKVPTSVHNQAIAFVAGLKQAAPLEAIQSIVHGTTVGTNALLERRGAKAGLITSKGFRDILELGRRTRPMEYGMTGSFAPLIPRYARAEVAERVTARGDVVVALDKEGLKEAALALKAAGVESLAVMFMHSYANPAQEQAAHAIIRELWPNDFISLSHEILPEVGEFERVSTTAINAYLQPLLDKYLNSVDGGLKSSGYRKSFRVMQSNGGALSVENTIRQACRSVLSGPAGGAIAAAWIGREAGEKHIVSADMGGTSFDVSLIVNGEPALADQKEFDYGIPSRIPMIDIETIGAGGGSIIYLDESGILHVGPESAGSEPGPICYGRGGTRPTVADANFLLGRLETANFLAKPVDLRAQVWTAFEALGRDLGTTALGAAEAALRVIDINMAGAIRRISLEKGFDTREFTLVPFGGAGPLHACSIADHLHIPKVLVPTWPGVTSALGCLMADVRHDDTWTVHRLTSQLEPGQTASLFTRMRARVLGVFEADGIAPDQVELRYEAALQYDGQTHRLTVHLPNDDVDGDALARMFEAEHHKRYGVTVDVPVRLINLRLRASAAAPLTFDIDHPALPTKEGAPRTSRIVFDGEGYEVPVWRREAMTAATVVAGPARIDQADTTTIVPPGWTARLDKLGNISIVRGAN